MDEKKYENDCCSKNAAKKHIKGIDCDVKSCAYHDGEDKCHAESVCIGPCDAKCSASTACATYKPGECC